MLSSKEGKLTCSDRTGEHPFSGMIREMLKGCTFVRVHCAHRPDCGADVGGHTTLVKLCILNTYSLLVTNYISIRLLIKDFHRKHSFETGSSVLLRYPQLTILLPQLSE